MKTNTKLFLIYLTLILASLIAYEPMRHNDFVNYDDDDHVTRNIHVLRGLTKEGFLWSFTETDITANWHPLTWLSHMLDVELFGTNPFWHHLVGLLFHIGNTLLLFFIFNKMTKAPWQSFFVAAAFALHPLHVESVAWASERKDVLSGFFWMLTIAAYVWYTANRNSRTYLLVVLCFTLGLMAKPMLVTLPFVLLLLDYWPLERFKWEQRKSFLKLVVEKLPLLLLSVVSSVVTFFVQQRAGAMISGENYSLITSISNAGVACAGYIVKLFYPVKLAVLYPHPGNSLPLWQPIAALAVLIFITAVVFYMALRKRFLFVGWLWYLGTLVPVIGFVQVGAQAMADRYTYLPSIGIFIMLGWGCAEVCTGWKYKKVLVGLITSVILVALLVCTRIQTSYWKNAGTLYEHTLKVTKNNYVIHNNYGQYLEEKGEFDLVVENYDKMLKIKPDYVAGLNNLGMVLRSLGKVDEAIVQWEKVLELEPYHPKTNANLGLVFFMQGRNEQAIKHFNIALRGDPDLPGVNYILGDIYYRTGNYERAIESFEHALRIQADTAVSVSRFKILFNLADSYAAAGDLEQAIKIMEKALETAINSDNKEMVTQIGKQLEYYKNVRFSEKN